MARRTQDRLVADAIDKMRPSYARMAEHMAMHGNVIGRSCAA